MDNIVYLCTGGPHCFPFAVHELSNCVGSSISLTAHIQCIWPVTALATATWLSCRPWWTTKVCLWTSLQGLWCLCLLQISSKNGRWFWYLFSEESFVVFRCLTTFVRDAVCPQCCMGHEAEWSPGPYCVQVEVECKFSFPFARWMWCSGWQLGCRMLSMPSVIKATKSKWFRKRAHGIGDVVKCQCFLSQFDNVMIKYDNF